MEDKAYGVMSPDEFRLLTWSVDEALKVEGAFVELGTFRAKTSRKLCRRIVEVDPSRLYIGVDSWPEAKISWEENVERLKSKPVVCFLNLTTVAAEDLVGICAWVFVDACHCYKCVCEDIKLWSPKIATNGIIVFHDTEQRRRKTRSHRLPHNGEKIVLGVKRAVEESEILKNEFEMVGQVKTDCGMRVYRRKT